MKIKKLAMIGFKSFMDRHEISFPIGISAVVGPNGCGKSNIVDAIRWAMGEQSAKQLRGRNMEDIIFNGAGDSKPLGMAEVSIIFENGDGNFPQGFAHDAELSITRRLYRSGESEYLLNNVPCRLKDIQEIFMDTGLGNRAYSIIGQGKIGTIVEQKPEETRVMLEEAAGITKYKRKVEESRRKLERTRDNLQRVEDVLTEVGRQMRSLKRQAAKARRFKSIGEEIQKLELTLNANAYHNLKEESGNKVKSTGDLIQHEVELTARLSGIQAAIENLSLDLGEKEGEVSRLRDTYLGLKEQFNRKESTLESLERGKQMQRDLEDRLVEEKEDLNRRLLGLQEERDTLEERAGTLRRSAEEMEEEISLLQKRLTARRELLKEAREEYERAREKVNSGVTREMGLNQESGYLTNRISEIRDSRARLEKEKSDVDIKISSLSGVSQKKNETRAILTDKLKEIEGDILKEQQRSDELNRMKKGTEADLISAESDLNVTRSKLSSLRSLTENFEGYKIGVRTIMKAGDLKARNEGRIMGLVADVIQVDPQYEQAVEAVMADKLQCVIVESQRDGVEAVDYLKMKAKGRSSFAPLKDLKDGHPGGNGNGYTLLRELVSVPDTYRPLIDALLGDAALVPDLEQAISAWSNNGKDRYLVTAEGDMVDRRGIISGGKLTNSRHGLLARKREIKELEVKTAASENQVAELRERLEGLEQEIEEKGRNLNHLIEEKSDCQDKINELDRTLFRLSHELDQLQKLSERISGELDQRGTEQSRHHEALKKIEEELQVNEAKKREEEEYLRLKERELKECEEEFDQVRDVMEKQKMDFNLSKEETRGLIREMERIDDFAEEAKERLERIDQDILEGQEKNRTFQMEEGALRQEMEGFYDALEEAERVVNLAEQDRNRIQGRIHEEEKKVAGLREALDDQKEKITRARMEQSEIGFKMSGLADMVKDKYNLDLTGIYRDYVEDDFSQAEAKELLERQKNLKERLGDVNLTAIQEHEALKERHTFITGQREDLLKSIDSINQVIRRINQTSMEKFVGTFKDVDNQLKRVFPILFNGGTAGLRLVDETKPLESGVLVEVKPPGKKLSHMGLLSGGEKALVAMALLFAIYLIKPSPFCLLDEVDAPLDEANIDRFNNLLQEIRKHSQILLVTHNRRSMEIVDSLYGVTMEKAGISKMVTVNLQAHDMN